MEELVAELGAAFLCVDLAISNTPRPDHAAYVASWLTVLKRDTWAIFTASGQAARAAAYLASVEAAERIPAKEVTAAKLACA
jgi:antirestriction protein ArdC